MSTMEERVVAEMRARADDVPVPLPPIDDLVLAGEAAQRQGRHRTLLAAAATIAVVVLAPWILLAHNHAHDATPRPVGPVTETASPTPSPTRVATSTTLASLPAGPPPSIPYLAGHELHVHGVAIPTTGTDLYAAGTTVLVQKFSETDPTWWILQGHRLVDVPELHGVFEVGISPDGDTVAWTSNPTSSTSRIVAWDPKTERDIARLDLPIPQTCCDGGSIQAVSVDGHGNVYWNQADSSVAWRPGSASHQILGRNEFMSIAPDGPVITAPGGEAGLLGRISATGTWTRIASLPSDQGLAWTPDGTLVATGAEALIPRTQQTVLFDLPSDATTQPIAFEGDGAVLLDANVGSGKDYVLRCSVSTKSCERALSPGPHPTRWKFSGNL
ncbi:MAG TPA: hypothetical protein VFE15_16705 [Marmoricola sp.]|jgi:hypothetical protein|nr:hypothetical protein [Marmoricola sp.]